MNTKTKKGIENLSARPPVIAFMGHIDHGKSTLLDYIRKTKTAEKEEGGITQHVSAYEAEVMIDGQKRKMTFLDTPGHEAFCSVREKCSSGRYSHIGSFSGRRSEASDS